MFRKIAPLAMGLTVLASATAVAQTGTPAPHHPQQAAASAALTLAAAQALAVQRNPELAAARREAEAAEGALLQAGARPNPALDMEMEDRRRDTRTTTIVLSQTLELGGKRAARMEAAQQALLIAQAQIDAKRVDIRASVATAFFAVLVAQDRVRLAEASLGLARQGTDVAGKRVTAGKVSPIEETRARVAEAGSRVELVQARGELQTAQHQLQTVLGLVTPVTRLDGDALALPPVMPADTLPARLQSAPALREAQLELRRLSALADLESARRTPDVTVSLGATRSAEVGRNQMIVGISVPLPVFDTNRGNLQEALRRRDKAEELLRATDLRLRGEAAIARERQIAATAEVKALTDDVLPGAQLAFDAASKGYELGKFGYLDVLDAQRTLQQARAQYLRALAEAHRAAADIDRLLGSADNATP